MRFTTIFRILGILLMIFSITMLPPIGIDLWFNEHAGLAFILAFCVTFFTGLCFWLCCRHAKTQLKTRDGFFIVVLFWSVLSIFGALPLMLAKSTHLTLVNAIFESVSGLTTTGATVLSGLDYLPHALLYYRQQLQFFGGMGIIVLAVAILPMLGIGGMQLYRAENTSLAKESKLTPRLNHTAKLLWCIYLGLTIACIFAYWAAGMTFFESICESFSTVSTGGFSIHDNSFAYYKNPIVDLVAITFMLFGGTNFSLHYYAMQRLSFKYYTEDLEFRTVFLTFLGISLFIAGSLFFHHYFITSPVKKFIDVLFTVVSVGTSTGLTVGNFQLWPGLLPMLIMFLGITGASAASTSGGIKMVRIILLMKQGSREIKRLIHPQAVLPIKLGNTIVDNELLQTVWGFIGMVILLYVLLTLALMGCGLDFRSAVADSICALGNVGVTVGTHAGSFINLSSLGKWLMALGMLAGRLEVFTLLVLLTPAFWRR